MDGSLRWALSALVALLANAAVLGTRGAPGASEALKGSGVWGHIFCDPSLMSGLSISLNGMPLHSATLLPALPPKAPGGGPQGADPLGSGGMPARGLQQAAEFHLPPLLPGSYLLEVLHPDVIFPKYRAVINSDSSTRFEVYTLNTYLAPSSTDPLTMPLKVGPVGIPHYTPVQGGFSLMDLLRQPLVILVLISLGIMYFMPKMQLEEETHQQVQQQHHHHEDQVVNMPLAEPSSAAKRSGGTTQPVEENGADLPQIGLHRVGPSESILGGGSSHLSACQLWEGRLVCEYLGLSIYINDGSCPSQRTAPRFTKKLSCLCWSGGP
ncbi:hypothetical protein Esti_004709 [Eimeria stiedai]